MRVKAEGFVVELRKLAYEGYGEDPSGQAVIEPSGEIGYTLYLSTRTAFICLHSNQAEDITMAVLSP